MARQLTLFERLPRAPRRVMMHPLDAGQGMALFRCKRCCAESGWIEVASLAKAMRGIPCPTCNPDGATKLPAVGQDPPP